MKGNPMKAAEKLIKSITQWSKGREEVRALILLGSHARKTRTDRMSDIDLCLFVTNPADLIDDRVWLHQFAPVWASTTEQEGDHKIVNVIYEPGLMVEIGIYATDVLLGMQSALPQYMESGYAILVDKDKTARDLPKPSNTYIPPEDPTPELFHAVIQRFWFNVYNNAKYIWRGEYWRAKTCDWQLKQDLLQMMGWHAALCRGQTNFTIYKGKHLQEWTDPETYTALMSAFGRFYPADSWRALEETIKLFSRLAKEIAETLATDYPQTLEEYFTALITDLKSNPE